MKSKPQSTERWVDIRKRREALHITQAEMAAVLGVSRLTYINYEKDISTMTLGKYILAENLILGLEQTKQNLLEQSL